MLFGTKNLAITLWYVALASALIFGVILLYAFIRSVWHTARHQGSSTVAILPFVIIVSVIFVWWRFFAFLATMP